MACLFETVILEAGVVGKGAKATCYVTATDILLFIRLKMER